MSCSVCRLPFVPDEARATSPFKEHFPPRDLMTVNQYNYHKTATAFGMNITGLCISCNYFSCNMFGGNTPGIAVTIIWEDNGTIFVMHNTCATLLRHVIGAEEDSLASFIKLAEIETVLGRAQGGANAGRFRFVDYEGVGEKIDLRPFWTVGAEEGGNVFNFKALVDKGMGWILARPDVFPRFFPEVAPERLASLLSIPDFERTDKITTLPMDILQDCILPYLFDFPASYVSLLSTCRFFRIHALSTFQPHARTLAVRLGWAVPTPVELASFKPGMRAKLASGNEKESPIGGDWFLYLSHVHSTKSMRVRRWVWALTLEFKRVLGVRMPGSGLNDLAGGKKSPERVKLEGMMKQGLLRYNQMREMHAERMNAKQTRK